MNVLRNISRLVVATSLAMMLLVASVPAHAAGTIIGPDNEVDIYSFGEAVAIDGNTAIVGAPDSEIDGAAFVFVHNGVTWQQEAEIRPPSGGGLDHDFGASVAISGDTIAISDADFGGFDFCGKVYIYTRSGSNWTLQQSLIPPPNPSSSSRFGSDLALQGNLLVVGHKRYSDPIQGEIGAAWVFQRAGSNWTPANTVMGSGSSEGLLLASDSVGLDQFGISVAIDSLSLEILVGASSALGEPLEVGEPVTRSGAVYYFKNTALGFDQIQKFSRPDGAFGDKFGASVSIDGSRAVVGSPGTDPPGKTNAGRAYVYVKPIDLWVEDFSLVNASNSDGDQFGQSVSLSGDTAIVGAPFDTFANGFGSSSVFIRDISNFWTEVHPAMNTPIDTMLGFGVEVAISGDTMIVGQSVGDPGDAYIITLAGLQCPADLDDDGVVSGTDSLILLGNWGSPGYTDINRDGETDGTDLLLLLGAWGACP